MRQNETTFLEFQCWNEMLMLTSPFNITISTTVTLSELQSYNKAQYAWHSDVWIKPFLNCQGKLYDCTGNLDKTAEWTPIFPSVLYLECKCNLTSDLMNGGDKDEKSLRTLIPFSYFLCVFEIYFFLHQSEPNSWHSRQVITEQWL